MGEYRELKNVIIIKGSGKKYSRHSNFVHKDFLLLPAGLHIDYDYDKPFKWELTLDTETIEGTDLKELIDVFEVIKTKFKDKCIFVYTLNLAEVGDFFEEYQIAGDKNHEYEMLLKYNICLRDVATLATGIGSPYDLAVDFLYESPEQKTSILYSHFAKFVFNNMIESSKSSNKVYKTAASSAKGLIKKQLSDEYMEWKDSVIPRIEYYEFIRHNVFRASICMNKDIKEHLNQVCFDQCSAHAHKLICKKFPVSKPRKVLKSNYDYHDYNTKDGLQYYLDNYFVWMKLSINGIYITHEGYDPFKLKGSKDYTLYVDKIQWQDFQEFYYFESYKIEEILIANEDYLPLELRKAIAILFLEKAACKNKDAVRSLKKVKLNAGSYGISVEKIKSDYVTYNKNGDIIKTWTNSEWANIWSERLIPPQVGVTITSHVMHDELNIISKITDTFSYCDTDSIWADDNDLFRELINKRNEEVLNEVKEFCTISGFDFELMKKLGQYEEDYHAKRFKAISAKEYLFLDENNKWNATTAGYASHYKSEWNTKKPFIPVTLYEPLKEGLDPIRYFNQGRKYQDYKVFFDEETLRRRKFYFKLTNLEHAKFFGIIRDIKELSKGRR